MRERFVCVYRDTMTNQDTTNNYCAEYYTVDIATYRTYAQHFAM